MPPFISSSILLVLASLVLVPAAGYQSTPPPAGSDTSRVYTQTEPSRNGIGRVYMGREISQVMGHRGAAWLERPERKTKERPDLVLDSMKLAPWWPTLGPAPAT